MGMATTEDLAIALNNMIVESLPRLHSVQRSLAEKCMELNETLSGEQYAIGEKLLSAIKQIPSAPLTRDNAWPVIESLTRPIYDLLILINTR
jgi:hypothetical protein